MLNWQTLILLPETTLARLDMDLTTGKRGKCAKGKYSIKQANWTQLYRTLDGFRV